MLSATSTSRKVNLHRMAEKAKKVKKEFNEVSKLLEEEASKGNFELILPYQIEKEAENLIISKYECTISHSMINEKLSTVFNW